MLGEGKHLQKDRMVGERKQGRLRDVAGSEQVFQGFLTARRVYNQSGRRQRKTETVKARWRGGRGKRRMELIAYDLFKSLSFHLSAIFCGGREGFRESFLDALNSALLNNFLTLPSHSRNAASLPLIK